MQIYREIVRKGRQRKKMQLEKNHPHNRSHALPPTRWRRRNDSSYTMKGVLWPPCNTAHAISVPSHPHSLARANQFCLFNYILYWLKKLEWKYKKISGCQLNKNIILKVILLFYYVFKIWKDQFILVGLIITNGLCRERLYYPQWFFEG